MTIKKPYTLPDPKADENFNRLYAYKLESRYKRVTSGVESLTYMAMESGQVGFSGTGSPTVAQTFALKERHGKIVTAMAHARSTLVTAHVTDVTQSSITIECRTVSGTANFSAVTTASITVYYSVLGSSP